jgi:hypothetical protein
VRRLILIALLILGWPLVSSGAAKLEPCGPGVANFAGTVISSGYAARSVGLEWKVWEDSTVQEYRLSRRSSGCEGSSCVTQLLRQRASSSQASLEAYSFSEIVPAGIWIYRLEVVRRYGLSCEVETGEVLVPEAPLSDVAAVCAQVQASFKAESATDGTAATGVKLGWATHAETAGVSGYRLSLVTCVTSRDCTLELATVEATGSCGDTKLYELTDSSQDAGRGTYRLEVLDRSGRTLCSAGVRMTPGTSLR